MSRSRRVAGWPALLAVVCGVAMILPALGGRQGAAPREAAPAEVLLADGCELSSTAKKKQRRLIRELLAQGDDAGSPAAVTVDYPQGGSIFPPEIAAPTFLWHDAAERADRWLIELTFGEDPARIRVLVPGVDPPAGEIDERCIAITNELYRPTPYQATARAWRPSAELWAMIKRHSVEQPATVTVRGYDADDPSRVLSRGQTTISTSRDPVGATIFYRDVPLMPSATKDGVIKPLDQSALPLIAWRLKDIGRDDSRVLLEDMPTCANCHSFSLDGKTLGMDVDGPDGDKGAYAVAAIDREVRIDNPQVFTWNAFPGRPRGHIIFGFLSRVSPDGRYVASTVNEALYVRNFPNHKFLQVFYPTRGILAWYSRETGDITALPGADDPDHVQCNAVWTPDGRSLVFARAKARNPYDRDRPVATFAGDPNETPLQYDLYRIPFNDGRGGTAQPIPGASANGMSNSFPKVSPDGKWLVWVQSRNGMLMRPDGKLWIMPLEGGQPRLMRCNLPLMNSWHSFSPNGRWMVFSSKSNTPYTQMFLTHIDEQGNDSPAILIENTTASNRAVNIPEFVNTAYDEFSRITVPAVNHYEHFAQGNRLAREGRHVEAVGEFEKALEDTQEWRIGDWRIHDSLSKVLLAKGEMDRALEHIEHSLRLNPYNPEMQANLGYILFERGQLKRARQHLDMAVRLAPDNAQLHYNRATLRASLGDSAGALGDFSEAVRLDPDYAEAYSGRGITRRADGDLDGAVADFNEAIRLQPDDPTPWYFRAGIRAERGDRAGARADARRALELCPPGSSQAADIRELLRQLE